MRRDVWNRRRAARKGRSSGIVLVKTANGPRVPPPVAFDQLERVDVSGIIRFLKESGLLSPEAANSAEELGELRNQYAHARGKAAQPDALKAIKLLHKIVEETVSLFKEYQIRNGMLDRLTSRGESR